MVKLPDDYDWIVKTIPEEVEDFRKWFGYYTTRLVVGLGNDFAIMKKPIATNEFRQIQTCLNDVEEKYKFLKNSNYDFSVHGLGDIGGLIQWTSEHLLKYEPGKL